MVTTSLQNVCYKKWCINLTSPPLPSISLKPPLVRVSDLPVDPSSLHLQSRGQVSSPSSGSPAHNSCSSCLDCWWCFSLSSNIHLSKILMIIFTFLTLTGPGNSSCYALPIPTFIFFCAGMAAVQCRKFHHHLDTRWATSTDQNCSVHQEWSITTTSSVSANSDPLVSRDMD